MLNLTLVTPQNVLVNDVAIEEVIVPAHRGELNILPGHAPLMTTLDLGILRYRLKGQEAFKEAIITWGYLEVSPSGVKVLAEAAEAVESLDKGRADRAWDLAKEKLNDPNLEMELQEKYQRKLRRAALRRTKAMN